MITAENLSFQVKGKLLVKSVTAAFTPQLLHLILGANGAGKSTLIKLLSGSHTPSKGKIIMDQKPLSSIPSKHLARTRAVLSQSVDFVFPLKVSQVVMMGRYPHFNSHVRKVDNQIVQRAMALFDVQELAPRIYNTLSGGEKQRVHFARVLAQIWPDDDQPRYLFLDEPLTYLDVKFQYDFLHQIKTLVSKYNITVIGVLHDLNLAARFADRLLLMKGGECIAQGENQQVLTEENIGLTYGIRPRINQLNNHAYIDFL